MLSEVRSEPAGRRLDPILLLPALLTLAIGAWGLGAPSYWRDEAATLDAEARSIPALLHMLTTVDAVHGTYYLLMWPIVHTFGTSEPVLRLPSLLAMTAAASGVAALGRRLHSPRAGLLAGLAFAVLPQVSRYAQEGRSYAFVLACAVLASYLLIRATTEPRPGDPRLGESRLAESGATNEACPGEPRLGESRPAGQWRPGATGEPHPAPLVDAAGEPRSGVLVRTTGEPPSVVRVSATSEPGVGPLVGVDGNSRSDLLVGATDQPRPCRLVRTTGEWRLRLLVGYGATIALLGLLNLFGLLLLAGHAVFLVARHRRLVRGWLVAAALGCLPALPVVVLAWRQRDQLGWLTEPNAAAPADLTVWLAGSTGSVVLVSVLIGLGLRARSSAATAWLALPWLLAPPALLLSAADIAMPVYVQRYVTYCLPALALPVGVGLAAVTVAPRVIALLLIAGLGLPTQLAQREVGGHGDTIRIAADILAAHERPGDGVLYDCPSCHYPDMPREFAFAYPAAFGALDDLALAASPSASGTLRGTETDRATLTRRIDGADRVWLVETGGSVVPTTLIGMYRVEMYAAGDISVSLYEH